MSEDKQKRVYDPRYRVRVCPTRTSEFVAFQDRFLEELESTGDEIRCVPLAEGANGYYTSRGLATIQMHDRSELTLIAFGCKDVYCGEWYAGELAFRALRAADGVIPRDRVWLTTWGSNSRNLKRLRDLVVIHTEASLENKTKKMDAGLLPLHYTNGLRVRPSETQIKDIEACVTGELSLEKVTEPCKIRYETTAAYAWHEKYGILPGFHEDDVPAGLEPFVLSRASLPVLPDVKRA
jgi:hypothetical protein